MKKYTLTVIPYTAIYGGDNLECSMTATCESLQAFIALIILHSAHKNDSSLIRWLLEIKKIYKGGNSLTCPTLSATINAESVE